MAAVKDAPEGDGPGAFDVFGGEFEEGLADAVGCVVDEDVEAAEGAEGFVEHALDLGAVAYVGEADFCAASHFFDGGGDFVGFGLRCASR